MKKNLRLKNRLVILVAFIVSHSRVTDYLLTSRRIRIDVVLEYLCGAINAGTRNGGNIRLSSITFLLKGILDKFLLTQVYILLRMICCSSSPGVNLYSLVFSCQSIRGMEDEGNYSFFTYSLHVSSSFFME